MDRVFLDANVLFSAAYSQSSPLRELWSLPETALITSATVVEEARRNLALAAPASLPRFASLLTSVTCVKAPSDRRDVDADLPDKDKHVITAAVAAGCTHLLTGDKRHFGRIFGTRVHNVLVLAPRHYLAHRSAATVPDTAGPPKEGPYEP